MDSYGYLIPSGFMGMVSGKWQLFATVDEYYEYLKETSE